MEWRKAVEYIFEDINDEIFNSANILKIKEILSSSESFPLTSTERILSKALYIFLQVIIKNFQSIPEDIEISELRNVVDIYKKEINIQFTKIEELILQIDNKNISQFDPIPEVVDYSYEFKDETQIYELNNIILSQKIELERIKHNGTEERVQVKNKTPNKIFKTPKRI